MTRTFKKSIVLSVYGLIVVVVLLFDRNSSPEQSIKKLLEQYETQLTIVQETLQLAEAEVKRQQAAEADATVEAKYLRKTLEDLKTHPQPEQVKQLVREAQNSLEIYQQTITLARRKWLEGNRGIGLLEPLAVLLQDRIESLQTLTQSLNGRRPPENVAIVLENVSNALENFRSLIEQEQQKTPALQN